jgi:hypothetical protein
MEEYKVNDQIVFDKINMIASSDFTILGRP